MKRIKGIIMLSITTIMLFALTACGKTTINLNKYVTLTAEGYDSMGTLSYKFDYDAFKKDYADKIKIIKNRNELIMYGGEEYEIFTRLCISKELDKTTNLSNGDVVTLKWTCDDAKAEECFDVKLEYSDITYTVKELEAVDKFNPFDYVTVSFSGTSPKGVVKITPNYDKAEVQYIKYSANKSSELKNGDTITITASISGNIDSFVKKYGCVLSESTRTYTCDSLASYITDVNDIPEDLMNKMEKQGEDIFKSHVASQWSKPENLISVSFKGNYFLTLKEGYSADINNYLYLLYEIQANNPKPEQTVNYYYYVRFDNIVKQEDGTYYVDMSKYTVPSTGWFSSETFDVGNYTYSGFEKLESLVNSCVTSKIEHYQYTTTIK